MPYQPTAAELHAAYRRARLWAQGWTYAKAIGVPCVAQSLANLVRAERARIEQQQGKPAPVQPALFEESPA